MWIQVAPNGDIFIVDEIVESFLSPQIIAQAVLGKQVRLPSGKIFCAPMPYSHVCEFITGIEATQSRQESGGLAIVDSLRNLGIERIRIVGGNIVGGIFAVRAKSLDANRNPHLFVHPRCKRLIDDFRKYHYPENARGSASELPEKDDIHDHTMDAVRYFVTSLEINRVLWKI